MTAEEIVILYSVGQQRTWEEQWKRVNRWFERFRETSTGRQHGVDSDNYQDEVYAFFQNCYHLKDWLQADGYSSGLVSDVEGFINNSDELKLCADLCNGSKHSKLKRPRTGDTDTGIGPRNFSLTLGTAEPALSVHYEIESGGQTLDAFAVAKESLRAWEQYLREKQLLP